LSFCKSANLVVSVIPVIKNGVRGELFCQWHFGRPLRARSNLSQARGSTETDCQSPNCINNARSTNLRLIGSTRCQQCSRSKARRATLKGRIPRKAVRTWLRDDDLRRHLETLLRLTPVHQRPCLPITFLLRCSERPDDAHPGAHQRTFATAIRPPITCACKK
jgi:hypothetical protein